MASRRASKSNEDPTNEVVETADDTAQEEQFDEDLVLMEVRGLPRLGFRRGRSRAVL